jgi:hypothetical protein
MVFTYDMHKDQTHIKREIDFSVGILSSNYKVGVIACIAHVSLHHTPHNCTSI